MRHDYTGWTDIERRSARRLPRLLFDYIAGGANEEITLARNRSDLDATRVRQRVMLASMASDTACRLFDRAWSMPVALAPVGFAGMVARRGEVSAARAAAAAGVAFTLSTFSICSLEEVARATDTAPMMQLYILDDDEWLAAFLRRALDIGVTQLFVTVDVPLPGIRYREARRPLLPGSTLRARSGRWADGMAHPRWLYDVFLRGRPHRFGNLPQGAPIPLASPSPDALNRIRQAWPHQLYVKGVLDPDDARLALDLGADGIVVSNHGGRQLDGARSTLSALGAVSAAVGGRCPILVDGGIRSGLDVLRMLASGASGCMIGRTWVHALAAGGEAGVAGALARIRHELATAMVLTGCNDIAGINRSVLD